MESKQKYRALVGLSYPTDARIIARLKKGEDIPLEARSEHRAEAGEIVDDIPVASIAWLLAGGYIEEVV